MLATNDHGSSDYSTPVSILAAQSPDQPLTPSTEISGSNVIIRWAAPPTGGSDITGYIVAIKTTEPNPTFETQLINCNGTNALIRTDAYCTVPILSLRS